MTSCEFERDQGHLVGTSRWRERLFDAPDLQHVDRRGAQLDRSLHRDRVHDAAVHVVQVPDAYRRQQSRHRRGGQNRVDDRSVVEPLGTCGLDAGCDALEADRQVLDPSVVQCTLQQPAQGFVGVQAGPLDRHVSHAVDEAPPEHPARLDPVPQLPQRSHSVHGRVSSDGGTVDRTDGSAEHQVRNDACGSQRLEHADLGSAQLAATTQDEGHRRAARPYLGSGSRVERRCSGGHHFADRSTPCR